MVSSPLGGEAHPPSRPGGCAKSNASNGIGACLQETALDAFQSGNKYVALNDATLAWYLGYSTLHDGSGELLEKQGHSLGCHGQELPFALKIPVPRECPLIIPTILCSKVNLSIFFPVITSNLNSTRQKLKP